MQPKTNKLSKLDQKNYLSTRPSGYTGILTILILIILIAVLSLAIANKQIIGDWWRLRGYQAPTAVVQLANQDTMNSYTRHLFFLNRPQLLSTVRIFRKDCPENKDTIVLGCYHPGQNGIYIYNVPDPTLAGVTQVTAAHEVLHAVYARLSNTERNNLDGQLENYYKNGLKDPRVIAEVKLYQQTEPQDVLDEMSCTFGTEIANLPEALSNYYNRFFTNRLAIVAYEQQYQGEFTSRENTINKDDQQLMASKQQIDNLEASLQAELIQLNADKSRLDGYKSTNQFSSYNAAVTGYNDEVNTYNSGIINLQTTITAYNQLVSARNQIAGQLKTIDTALDTRLTQQSTR